MKAIATIALTGLVLFVGGLVTQDDAMANIGSSTFSLGSMVVSALLMRRRYPKRDMGRKDARPKARTFRSPGK